MNNKEKLEALRELKRREKLAEYKDNFENRLRSYLKILRRAFSHLRLIVRKVLSMNKLRNS